MFPQPFAAVSSGAGTADQLWRRGGAGFQYISIRSAKKIVCSAGALEAYLVHFECFAFREERVRTATCSSACTVVVLPRSVAKCSGHRPIEFSWSTNRVRPCAGSTFQSIQCFRALHTHAPSGPWYGHSCQPRIS